jgi:hypothetical protein
MSRQLAIRKSKGSKPSKSSKSSALVGKSPDSIVEYSQSSKEITPEIKRSRSVDPGKKYVLDGPHTTDGLYSLPVKSNGKPDWKRLYESFEEGELTYPWEHRLSWSEMGRKYDAKCKVMQGGTPEVPVYFVENFEDSPFHVPLPRSRNGPGVDWERVRKSVVGLKGYEEAKVGSKDFNWKHLAALYKFKHLPHEKRVYQRKVWSSAEVSLPIYYGTFCVNWVEFLNLFSEDEYIRRENGQLNYGAMYSKLVERYAKDEADDVSDDSVCDEIPDDFFENLDVDLDSKPAAVAKKPLLNKKKRASNKDDRKPAPLDLVKLLKKKGDKGKDVPESPPLTPPGVARAVRRTSPLPSPVRTPEGSSSDEIVGFNDDDSDVSWSPDYVGEVPHLGDVDEDVDV